MTAMPDDDLVAASASGDRFEMKEHLGALVLVRCYSHETGIITVASPEPTQAIRADVDVLDGPDAGAHYADTLLFGRVLVNRLKPSVGKRVVGRVAQGAKQPGKNPPWQLDEPNDADMAKARAFLSGARPAAAMTKASSADAPPF